MDTFAHYQKELQKLDDSLGKYNSSLKEAANTIEKMFPEFKICRDCDRAKPLFEFDYEDHKTNLCYSCWVTKVAFKKLDTSNLTYEEDNEKDFDEWRDLEITEAEEQDPCPDYN